MRARYELPANLDNRTEFDDDATALVVSSLCITFSHAFCAGTWLFREPYGFYGALSFCIGCAILFVLALEMSRADKAPGTE